MAVRFSDPSAYLHKSGTVILGRDEQNCTIGIDPERHLITVAGSRSGKGAALIVPNAREWSRNLLVIDPKGENARLSWEAREAMGQRVVVVDPYGAADVPDRLRGSFNPLAEIDPTSSTAREDLEVIADGMVIRADPKHAQWDNGAADLLAGVMAYVMATAPAELRTLASVRAFLLQPDESLKADTDEMVELTAYGSLAKSAALTIRSALKDPQSMERQFLEGARRHSAWVDSDAMITVLGASSFQLSDLKSGNLTLFLVLPPKYMAKRAGFLRLFVRSALDAMMAREDGQRCLFVLDEFYSLGRIDEIAKSAGQLASYGVHLWPFLQDLGQLEQLYTEKGAGTFFANADAHLFFGNDQDPHGLGVVSKRLGAMMPNEVLSASPVTTPYKEPFWANEEHIRLGREAHKVQEENARRDYEHTMKQAGRPRLSPDEIARLTGKGDADEIARSMIVFMKGGDVLNLKLAPYFEPPHSAPETAPPAKSLGRFVPVIVTAACFGFVALVLPVRWSVVGGPWGQLGFIVLATVAAFWAYNTGVGNVAQRVQGGFLRHWKLLLLTAAIVLAAADMLRQGHDWSFIGSTLFSVLALVGICWVGYRVIRHAITGN